jgi:hypothetical protein
MTIQVYNYLDLEDFQYIEFVDLSKIIVPFSTFFQTSKTKKNYEINIPFHYLDNDFKEILKSEFL